MARSTRISIVEQSLQDIVERILELPPDAVAEDLHRRARAVALSIAQWSKVAPTREERAAALAKVLDLNIEVMKVSRERAS